MMNFSLLFNLHENAHLITDCVAWRLEYYRKAINKSHDEQSFASHHHQQRQ